MKFLYKKVLKPILFLFSPDFIHNLFVNMGEFMSLTGIGRAIIGLLYDYNGKDISKTVDGITYRTPILLSAGFDYNGRLTRIMDKMGFGGVEIGSVTLRKTIGNPKPNTLRAKKSKSIIVYKGLKNDGVDVIIERLKKRQNKRLVIGVSIARTNDEQASSDEEGIKDYIGSFNKLIDSNVGDYYTFNISCPNAFSGERFTDPSLFDKLLTEVKKVECTKPLYVKMPISIGIEQFDQLLEVVIKHKMNGVIIGNLNKDYNSLDYREEAPEEYRGGLSGKPCTELSNILIKHTRERVGKDFTIIGCGGILSPEDAMTKFDAGADLLMLITGMIFEGPHLIKEIGKAIEERNNLN
jgi:dihydroorotate dehydrogenase subfamily 2